jgi:hypothetical protein
MLVYDMASHKTSFRYLALPYKRTMEIDEENPFGNDPYL